MKIHGLEVWEKEDLLCEALDHIETELSFIDGLKVRRVFAVGSRVSGKHREDSDLDIVFEYEGSVKEGRMSDILNERLLIDDIAIDFLGMKQNFEDVVSGRAFVELT